MRWKLWPNDFLYQLIQGKTTYFQPGVETPIGVSIDLIRGREKIHLKFSGDINCYPEGVVVTRRSSGWSLGISYSEHEVLISSPQNLQLCRGNSGIYGVVHYLQEIHKTSGMPEATAMLAKAERICKSPAQFTLYLTEIAGRAIAALGHEEHNSVKLFADIHVPERR